MTKETLKALQTVSKLGKFTLPARNAVQIKDGWLTRNMIAFQVRVAVDGLPEGAWDVGILATRAKAGSGFEGMVPFPAADLPAQLKVEAEGETVHGLPEALDAVLPAASSDVFRYNLNVVSLDKGELTATDGHRLSIVKLRNVETSVLFSIDAAKAIVKLCSDDDLYLSMGKEYVRVKQAGVEVIWRKPEVQFPDYHQVIPTKFARVDRVSVENLKAALKALAPAVKWKKRSVADQGTKVHFKSAIHFETRHPDFGEIKASCQAYDPRDGAESKELTAAYSIRYLLDAVALFDGCESVDLSVADDKAPIVLTPIVLRWGDRTHVLMPCRL